jgi:hypothetical protein
MKRMAPPVLLAAFATVVLAQDKPRQPGQLPSPDADAGALSLPNTISAPPFDVGDKFDYRIVQSFGLRGLGGSLVGAAIGQAVGTPYEWGGGVEGFAKRYASGLAGNLSRQSFAFVLESALHEDPRYFPSHNQPRKARIMNALKQVVTCKTDSGDSTIAYGRIISAFGAGQLAATWQPATTSGVGAGFRRGIYTLGGDFAYNLLQEFLPFTRPHSIRHRP